ncbi:MFS transporter [Pseudoneobacillus sp. C159]
MGIFLNRNFLWMFLGRVITNIGDSLYAVASMWLVYDLGGSTFYTGLAGFLTIFPRFIQLLAGPFIDRLPIRSLLVYTQIIQAVLLVIIPATYYLGELSIVMVLIISPILTTLNMLVFPAQMASLPKFVDSKDLSKANSYFSLAYQGIDMACNSLAGVLIIAIGAVSIYFVDSIMFFLGAILFSLIRIPKQASGATQKSQTESLSASVKKYMGELKIGISVLFHKTLSRLLLGVIVINLVGGATFVVLPAFSQQKGGPQVFGLLLTAQAIGSISGALLAPYLKLEGYGLGKVYSVAFLISGFMWAVAVFSPWTWLTILTYGLAWLPGGVTNILINTCLQKSIPKDLLGRVFSASYSISGIAMPLGSLIGGGAGALFGSAAVICVSGMIVFLVGVFWMFDKHTRNIPKTENINESTFLPQLP